jgi:Glycosyl transferase family 2
MIIQSVNAINLSKPLISTPPHTQCQVSVIIPVKDEAHNLTATLAALAGQVDLDGQPLCPHQYEAIVLANNCTDNSAAIARQFAREHPHLAIHVAEMTLPPDRAYIGYVRKLLMDEAYNRLMSLGHLHGIIASTDGDTRVSPTWIAATRAEIATGVDAVGGRILTDRQSRHELPPQARTFFLQEVGYRFLVAELEYYLDPDPYDPLPRHYQHYGASLAVTAQMYAKAGGLPPVRTPEDEAFYQSLLRVNARFRHSLRVQVTTSARATGRSPVGLANQLTKWSEMSSNSALKVEPAAAVVSRFRARRKLRLVWQKLDRGEQLPLSEIDSLAHKLGVTKDWLLSELFRPQTFGRLFEKVTQYQQKSCLGRWPLIDVKTAIMELRQSRTMRLELNKMAIDL